MPYSDYYYKLCLHFHLRYVLIDTCSPMMFILSIQGKEGEQGAVGPLGPLGRVVSAYIQHAYVHMHAQRFCPNGKIVLMTI